MSWVAEILALVCAATAGAGATQRDANMGGAATCTFLALAFGAAAMILHR